MLGKGRLRWLAAGMGVVGVTAAMASRGLQFGTIADYAACFAVGAGVYYRGLGEMSVRGRRVIDAGLVAVLVCSLGVVVWQTLAKDGLGGRSAAVEMAVASGFGIGLIVVRPLSGAVSRMRWIAPLNWLGTISYSLFLIHPINLPLVNSMTDGVLPESAPKWVVVCVRLAWHVALGAAFWWMCERPFVRLMERRRGAVAERRGAVRIEAGTMGERVSAMLPS
jgi:peptidoglycan/LPS O-acetylase OafA/YrhL